MGRFPSQRGALEENMRSGFEQSYKLVGSTYQGKDGQAHLMYPAIEYAADTKYANEHLAKGKWFLPSIYEMFKIYAPIEQGYTDAANRSFDAIGGSKITFGVAWSSSRRYAGNAWRFDSDGYVADSNFNYSFASRGFALLDMNEVNL